MVFWEDILAINEAAEILHIPVSSVDKLAQEGRVPSQKVGCYGRFHRMTLLNWISGEMKFDDKKNNLRSLEFS